MGGARKPVGEEKEAESEEEEEEGMECACENVYFSLKAGFHLNVHAKIAHAYRLYVFFIYMYLYNVILCTNLHCFTFVNVSRVCW